MLMPSVGWDEISVLVLGWVGTGAGLAQRTVEKVQRLPRRCLSLTQMRIAPVWVQVCVCVLRDPVTCTSTCAGGSGAEELPESGC